MAIAWPVVEVTGSVTVTFTWVKSAEPTTIVGSVPADTAVLINGCTGANGFCAIRHDGRHGWVPFANVDLTGITRSTNKFDDSVIVLDLTNQLPMPYPAGYRRNPVVPNIASKGGAPVVRLMQKVSAKPIGLYNCARVRPINRSNLIFASSTLISCLPCPQLASGPANQNPLS